MKDYKTVGEVAKELCVSNVTILRAIKDGKIKASKTPGGHHRISLNEITRLKAELQFEEDQLC